MNGPDTPTPIISPLKVTSLERCYRLTDATKLLSLEDLSYEHPRAVRVVVGPGGGHLGRQRSHRERGTRWPLGCEPHPVQRQRDPIPAGYLGVREKPERRVL